MSKPNKIQIQLEAALRDAETATAADISAQKLIQTRLTILNKMASRRYSARIRRLREQLATSEAENQRLRDEISRLAQASVHPTAIEINEVLRKYGEGGKDAV
jgi:glucan phosphorylase